MNNVETQSWFTFLDRHLIYWCSSNSSWRRVFSALQAIGVVPATKQLHTYFSRFINRSLLNVERKIIYQINSPSEQTPKDYIVFPNLNEEEVQEPTYLWLTSLSIASSCNKTQIRTAVEMFSKTRKKGSVSKYYQKDAYSWLMPNLKSALGQ